MADGVNRFYNPSRGQYISQYIPTQIPAELMLSQLNQKQQQYNQAAQQAQMLGDWTQPALAGDDTTYIQNKRKEIRNFVDTFGQKVDPTSPEGMRQYQDFVRGIRDDNALKMIASNYAIDQEAQKRIKQLKEGRPEDYDPAFEYSYKERLKEYTTPGSGGYSKLTLEDPSILAGTDIQASASKFFDDLRANGYESAVKSGLEGLYYKQGWEGITNDRIRSQVKKNFDTFYQSRAGEQLGARFDAAQGVTRSQRASKGQEYEQMRQDYVKQQLLDIGSEYEFSKSQSNKADILNKVADRKYEEQQKYSMYNPLEYTGEIESNTLQDYGKDVKTAANNAVLATQVSSQAKWLNDKINKGQNIIFANLPQAYKDMLSGVPGFQQAMSTGVLNMTPDTKKALQGLLDNKNNQYENLKNQNEQISNNEVNALSRTMEEAGINIVGNKTYAQAVNDLKSINPTKREMEFMQANIDKFGKLQGKEFDKFISDNKSFINSIYGSSNPQVVQRLKTLVSGVDAMNKSFGIKNPEYYQNKMNELSQNPIANLGAINEFKKTYDNVINLNKQYNENYKTIGSKQDIFLQPNLNEKYVSTLPQLDAQGNITGYVKGTEISADTKLGNYIRSNPRNVTLSNGSIPQINETTKLTGILKTEKEPGTVTANIQTKVPYIQKYRKDDGSMGYTQRTKIVNQTVVIRDTDYQERRQDELASYLRGTGKFDEVYDRSTGKYIMTPNQPLNNEEGNLYNIVRENQFDNISRGIKKVESNLDRKPRELSVDQINIGGGNYNLNVQKNESGFSWYLTDANGNKEPIGEDSQGKPLNIITSNSIGDIREYLYNMERIYKTGK